MQRFKYGPIYTAVSLLVLASGAQAQTDSVAAEAADAKKSTEQLEIVVVTAKSIGKGEARANSVITQEDIKLLPQGLDPLRMLSRIPGLQVGSSDALTGSFSMRLSMRGFNKEQIGVSIDGIPNGSTLSNGGTMPNRLLDPSNVSKVNVSQTAGEIATPSNQALGGFIDFQTRNPAKKSGADAEVAFGNYGYQRAFVRYDTGEIVPGLTAYVNGSSDYVRTWPGDQSGRSRRDHLDVRVLQQFGNGSSLRGTVSYNNMASNDYDAVALRAITQGLYKANFETDPTTDGLTDKWTGNPAIDQNNRRTRGINSKEIFAHLDASVKVSENFKLTASPYYHHQEGAGWFYVPYKQVPSNGVVYSAVAAGGKPTSTVQECYVNQYQKDANGALIPVAAVTFPAGVTAATLSSAGCPAAARFAMNPAAQWGAREATTRRGGYEMNRRGTVAEGVYNLTDEQTIRFGGWYESIDRTKTRNWYLASDPSTGFGFNESALYSITQDRNYNSKSSMGYIQDKLRFLDDAIELEIGATYQNFKSTYRSPVEFFGTRELSVSSGVLPKIAALFQLGNNIELFTSTSKNFSAIPDSVFEGTSAIDSKTGIKPETSQNTDVGLRWLGKRAGASLVFYNIRYKDRISIQNGNPNGDIFSRDATTTFLNQGGISSRGFEATYRMDLNPFEINTNYSYTNAKYVADTPAEGITAGDPVLGVARQNFFFELAWRPNAQWNLRSNIKYVGQAAGTYNVVANGTAARPIIAGGPLTYPREYMPAYTLVGMSGTYKWSGNLELTASVDNLFDKRYLGGLGMELTTASPLTSGRYFLGSPRTFFFGARYRM